VIQNDQVISLAKYLHPILSTNEHWELHWNIDNAEHLYIQTAHNLKPRQGSAPHQYERKDKSPHQKEDVEQQSTQFLSLETLKQRAPFLMKWHQLLGHVQLLLVMHSFVSLQF